MEETLTEGEQVDEASLPNATGASQSARSREKLPALPIKKRTSRTTPIQRGNTQRNNPCHPAKRAETRRCPVCDEVVPIRLLGKHAELEAERLEEIIRCIGSTEVLGEAEPEDRCVYRL